MEEQRAWVERVTGGRILGVERLGAGSSRATWSLEVETSGRRRELVLRVDTGDGPMAGTELDLSREALVYRALGERSVSVPRLIEARKDALLVERAPGTEALDGLDPDAQAKVMAGYVDELAKLHRIDVDTLELPGFERPSAPGDHARLELALWRRLLHARVSSPPAFAEFAFERLERSAPTDAVATSLCHGDVGPGNFLHAGGRVTALLDWEFAHVGDPMDDLGWLAFRGHHVSPHGGSLEANLERWSRATGLPVVARSVSWYRALVMLRWLVACLAALENAPREMDPTVYRLLVPALTHLLPVALLGLGEADDVLRRFARDGERGLEEFPHLAPITRKPLAPIPEIRP